jgi:XTP/dITP diphosphohydrolase
MRTPLLVATTNKGKAREFQEMLGSDWAVLTSSEVTGLPQVVEDGASFEANACKKALENAACFSGWVLADDSGLEVDYLKGAPGIYSARFAGEPSDDSKNNHLLQQKLRDVPEQDRGAQFVCVLALARGAKVEGIFRGVLRGKILDQAQGHGGFGYDPLFVPDGYEQSLAELGPEIKHQISHRAAALRELRSRLSSLVGKA